MAKHRGRGEGSISMRNGKYRAQVTLGNGERVSGTFKTKKEASAWILERKNEAGNGLVVLKDLKSIADFIDSWLADVKHEVKPRTYCQYKDYCQNDIKPALGHLLLREIQPIHVRKYITSEQNKGRGERTVQLIYAVMHVMFEAAKNLKVIVNNPCDGMKRPKVKKKSQKPVQVGDGKKLLALETLTPQDNALFYLALTTGIRRGELLGLLWEDLDFLSGKLFVHQQVQWIPGLGTSICEMKTEGSIRHLHLSSHTLELLNAHQQSQQQLKAAKKDRWKEFGLIFPSSVGTPWNPSNFLRRYKKLWAEGGLEKTRFHNFRHGTLTTATLELGADVKTVGRLAGHAEDSRVTLDTYIHPSQGDDRYRSLAEGFDRLYGFQHGDDLTR